jgi:hypothetical protein
MSLAHPGQLSDGPASGLQEAWRKDIQAKLQSMVAKMENNQLTKAQKRFGCYGAGNGPFDPDAESPRMDLARAMDQVRHQRPTWLCALRTGGGMQSASTGLESSQEAAGPTPSTIGLSLRGDRHDFALSSSDLEVSRQPVDELEELRHHRRDSTQGQLLQGQSVRFSESQELEATATATAEAKASPPTPSTPVAPPTPATPSTPSPRAGLLAPMDLKAALQAKHSRRATVGGRLETKDEAGVSTPPIVAPARPSPLGKVFAQLPKPEEGATVAGSEEDGFLLASPRKKFALPFGPDATPFVPVLSEPSPDSPQAASSASSSPTKSPAGARNRGSGGASLMSELGAVLGKKKKAQAPVEGAS